MVGAVNFIVTMMKLRAPGMTFCRMPLFALATFLNSFLILFAIPSLTAAVGMLYLDRHFGTAFFNPAKGGDPLVWQHLFWFFGHPEVYILILPVFGMISEIVPVFSRKPLFGRGTMIIMLSVIGFLSFMVWAHHMFAVGLPTYFNAIMAAHQHAHRHPHGREDLQLAGDDVGRRRCASTRRCCSSCGLIALFTIGGITGVTLAVVPFDWQVTDTYYIVAHLHNVLFAGTVFGVFGAFYYWFPKMTGRILNDRLGKRALLAHARSASSSPSCPCTRSACMGMPRRVYTYAPDLGWNTLNLISSMGGYLIGRRRRSSSLVNIVRSLRVAGERAGDNPWDAWTLEWATTLAAAARELRVAAADPQRPAALGPRASRASRGSRSRWTWRCRERPAPRGEVRAIHSAGEEISHETPLPVFAGARHAR